MKRTSLKAPLPHKTAAFISYSHDDRAFGAQAKNVLESLGFETFLAHQDVEISAEWRERILDELRRCALFVLLLSNHFIESKWASQEVGPPCFSIHPRECLARGGVVVSGFIIARPEVVLTPISLDGTMPFGFISHLQARLVPAEGMTEDLLLAPLARKFPRQILPMLIFAAGEAQTFRSAEAHLRPLAPLFKLFEPAEAQALATASVENGQIWLAQECRDELLPEFLRVQSHHIEPTTLRALEYQLEHGQWFPRDADATPEPVDVEPEG